MKTSKQTGFGFRAIQQDNRKPTESLSVIAADPHENRNRVEIVVVKWWDAAGSSGPTWSSAAELDPPTAPTLTTGFLWSKSESFITVVATIDDSLDQDEVTGVMHIPVGTIIAIQTIGYVELDGGEDRPEESENTSGDSIAVLPDRQDQG